MTCYASATIHVMSAMMSLVVIIAIVAVQSWELLGIIIIGIITALALVILGASKYAGGEFSKLKIPAYDSDNNCE